MSLALILGTLGAAPLSAASFGQESARLTIGQAPTQSPAPNPIPPPAQAPSQAAPTVRVELDRINPAVLAPDQPWSARGTISNLGTTTLDVERVRLTTAYRALDTVDDLQVWIDEGEIVQTPREVGTAELGSSLGPGDSAEFFVPVSDDAVRPSFSFGSLPLRVDVEAADNSPLAEIRTVLPWYAFTSAADPLEVSWVVPLTVPPDPALTAPEPDGTQAWLDVVGPDSPARNWLDGLTAYDATFVIDPSMLLPLPPATDIAEAPLSELTPSTDADDPEPSEQPSPTEAPNGTDNGQSEATQSAQPTDGNTDGGSTFVAPGDDHDNELSDDSAITDLPTQIPLDTLEVQEATPVQQAELALQERIGVLTRGQLRWLPVADPDTAALLELDADPAIVERVMGASLPPSVLEADRLLQRGSHGIAWPAWNLLEADRIEALEALWGADPVTTLVVPRSLFNDTTGLNRDAVGTLGQGSELTVYGYDEEVSALLAPAQAGAGDGATTQLVLAHLLARYQQFPANSGALIIAPPRGASLDAAALDDLTGTIEQAPWVDQIHAAELPVQPDVRIGQVGTAAEPEPSPLSDDRVTRVEQVRATLDEVATVMQRQETATAWNPVLDGLYSTRWRGSDEEWSSLLDQLESNVATIVDGVRIQETSVNFLANEGLIQLTLVNDLPVGLRDLDLELVPGNARLRIAEQPQPIAIGANSRATVQFRAEAVAAGQVPVSATLSTPAGLQIGQAQELDVQVRPTGIWIYWLLGGVAGVILILGLTRAIRRPRSSPESEPAPESTTEAGPETEAEAK